MAIRVCAAHPWQAEQAEPLSSVSGEMFLVESHPALEGSQIQMLSFHHTLTAAHFMDYCPPPTAEIVQTLSYVTASRRWALQSASSIRNNSFLEINKKNCSMLMRHLCFMTEVQTVNYQGSIGYGWCGSLILPCCIEQWLQLSENLCVGMCCVQWVTYLVNNGTL